MESRARRVIVISDLHLGGKQPAMMTSGARLAHFIDAIPARLMPDEDLDLVIAGDFIDFLALVPFSAWTGDPVAAVAKLHNVLADPSFADVFQALGRLVARGDRLTILLGNHDVELALPAVQRALLHELNASPHRVKFIADGRALRLGSLLIEHGNRYDPSNENDWNAVRVIASAQSRFEQSPVTLRPSAGSYVVEKVVSPLKTQYPFIDLLQPQGEVLALLLVAFEPGLLLDWTKLVQVFRAKRLQDANPDGLQPYSMSAIAAQSATQFDADLADAFGDTYRRLHSGTQPTASSDIFRAAWHGRTDGLARLIENGACIPEQRLKQIQVALRKLLLDDDSARVDGDTGQYGQAAQRLIKNSHGEIDLVVMGHTHLARHSGPESRANYINTGTWADIVRVPPEVLLPAALPALEQFLRALLLKPPRITPATFADIRLQSNGRVALAKLDEAPTP